MTRPDAAHADRPDRSRPILSSGLRSELEGRLLDARFAEGSSHRIAAIDEALVRLREHPERYGACEICGTSIDLERLQMIPWARRCGEHAPSEAAAVERDG